MRLLSGETERARPVLSHVADHPQSTGHVRDWSRAMLETAGASGAGDERVEDVAGRVLSELEENE